MRYIRCLEAQQLLQGLSYRRSSYVQLLLTVELISFSCQQKVRTHYYRHHKPLAPINPAKRPTRAIPNPMTIAIGVVNRSNINLDLFVFLSLY